MNARNVRWTKTSDALQYPKFGTVGRRSTCPTEAKQSLAALDEAALFSYPRSAGEHRPLNSVMQAFNPTL